MTRQHLGEIANGDRKGITLSVATKIAEALGVPVGKVFVMK